MHDAGLRDVEIDGTGKPDRLVELAPRPAIGRPWRVLPARRSTGSITSARPLQSPP